MSIPLVTCCSYHRRQTACLALKTVGCAALTYALHRLAKSYRLGSTTSNWCRKASYFTGLTILGLPAWRYFTLSRLDMHRAPLAKVDRSEFGSQADTPILNNDLADLPDIVLIKLSKGKEEHEWWDARELATMTQEQFLPLGVQLAELRKVLNQRNQLISQMVTSNHAPAVIRTWARRINPKDLCSTLPVCLLAFEGQLWDWISHVRVRYQDDFGKLPNDEYGYVNLAGIINGEHQIQSFLSVLADRLEQEPIPFPSAKKTG